MTSRVGLGGWLILMMAVLCLNACRERTDKATVLADAKRISFPASTMTLSDESTLSVSRRLDEDPVPVDEAHEAECSGQTPIMYFLQRTAKDGTLLWEAPVCTASVPLHICIDARLNNDLIVLSANIESNARPSEVCVALAAIGGRWRTKQFHPFRFVNNPEEPLFVASFGLNGQPQVTQWGRPFGKVMLPDEGVIMWRRKTGLSVLDGLPPTIAQSFEGENYYPTVVWRETSSGKVDWKVTLAGSGINSGEAVHPCSDGSFLITGYFSDDLSVDGKSVLRVAPSSSLLRWENETAYFIKVSSRGKVLWAKSFGPLRFGSEGNLKTTLTKNDFVLLVATFTGIVTARNDADEEVTISAPLGRGILAAELDTNGSLRWVRRLGTGWAFFDYIAALTDGKYLVKGFANPKIQLKDDSGKTVEVRRESGRFSAVYGR